MANFPETPGLNDPHVEGGINWIYDGDKWVKQSPTIHTDNVALLDPSNPAAVLEGSYGNARKLPTVPVVSTQYDVNKWFVEALTELDSHYDNATGGFVAGIYVGENEPGEKEHGTLWFDSSEDSLTLFLYYDPDDDPSTAAWIPAAPPVSAIEELEQLIQGLGDDLDLAELRLNDLNTHGVDAPLNPQDGFIWNNSSPGIKRSYMYEVGRLDGTTGWTLLSPNARISDTSPVEPEVGDLWYEPTVSKTLSVYDGTSWNQLTVGADGITRIEDIETDQATQDGRLDDLEIKVEDLQISKGSIARYELTSIEDSVQARPGEFNINTDTASTVTTIYLNAEDSNGAVTRPVAVGDIVEVIDPLGTTARYVSQSNTTLIMNVVHVSGNFGFVVGQNYDFYIYPMNEAGATQDYVDQQDALKVSKSGDRITGVLSISSEGNANDDGVRLYMKDSSGATNLTMFPSGVITGKNVIRVNRDTGDAFQVKDAGGNSVKWKVDADGKNSVPKIFLTGGSSSNKDERTIDVQHGFAGHLSYNNKVDLSWGATTVWIGRSTATGDADDTCTLDLQNNKIINVGRLTCKKTDKFTGNVFSIEGEMKDGSVGDNWFYAYRNANGTPDAMNYNGKMDNEFNLVNKKYVDDAVGGVSTDSAVQKTGDTMTGTLTMNAGGNQQINFLRGTNSDIQVNGTWYISLQEADGGKVKLNKTLDMTNKEIKDVANPTTSKSAVNKQSLIGAKVVSTSGGISSADVGGFFYSNGKLFYRIS